MIHNIQLKSVWDSATDAGYTSKTEAVWDYVLGHVFNWNVGDHTLQVALCKVIVEEWAVHWEIPLDEIKLIVMITESMDTKSLI